MKIKIKDENGNEEILYEYKLEPSKPKPKSSIFSKILVFFLIIFALISIMSFILFLISFPYSILFVAFILILIILKPEIETIILDNGLKSVIVTYNYYYKKNKTIKAIKFSDIKEVKIIDSYDYESGDYRHITLIRRNDKWYGRNWLNESVHKNQFAWDMGIAMSKTIGVNCYYIDMDKKSTMLYEAQ
jgi:hypothetical protein